MPRPHRRPHGAARRARGRAAPPRPPAFASHRETVTELLQAGKPFAEVEAAIERTDLDEDTKSALWLVAYFLRDSQARPQHARAHRLVR